ncbi:1-acyl-sn-glycerol-3-phosphate acyltransferase [Oceaniovalibus guishaninsula]|nr:1-acyl-sn-glycerol-3-phosphate acyltransferase [Oceaniovalibus guishaninsula]
MKERIDDQILERAPWLGRGGLTALALRPLLHRMLSYQRTVDLAEEMADWNGARLMNRMAAMLARDVQATGLDNVPRHGRALVVANHPTGIADGVILWHLLAPLRPDLFVYANADILKVLPNMGTLIAPVEWRLDKRTHAKTRETMAFTRKAMAEERLGVIFPSGRLAKRRGLQLHERPWMTSAAMLARKFDAPVVPVNIRARNSVLFYLFDLIHPTLRDITLFHELLNKARQPYRISVGEPISPASMPKGSEDAIELAKRTTLALGGRHAPSVSLLDTSRRPAVWTR